MIRDAVLLTLQDIAFGLDPYVAGMMPREQRKTGLGGCSAFPEAIWEALNNAASAIYRDGTRPDEPLDITLERRERYRLFSKYGHWE